MVYLILILITDYQSLYNLRSFADGRQNRLKSFKYRLPINDMDMHTDENLDEEIQILKNLIDKTDGILLTKINQHSDVRSSFDS